jgi:hypothetical protein
MLVLPVEGRVLVPGAVGDLTLRELVLKAAEPPERIRNDVVEALEREVRHENATPDFGRGVDEGEPELKDVE